MTVSDFIIKFLIKKKVTDLFGIPGEIIFDFLYAINRHKPKIESHLNFHEQNSCFAASGYARSTQKLGVAYATRGPGITNMVTAVADAYCDSIPLLIITAHSGSLSKKKMRVISDQEIDTISIFSGITKYCAKVSSAKNAQFHIEKAYFEAMNGRKGPVFLDFNKKIFSKKIKIKKLQKIKIKKKLKKLISLAKKKIINKILESKKPVFLIGDGFRYAGIINQLIKISEKNKIPILSSRFSQDLVSKSKFFFGYFGSHGLRYSNFILSKSDLIIALGHRMLFLNNKSKSFKKIFNKSSIIRVDIDSTELSRKIHNSTDFNMGVTEIVSAIKNKNIFYKGGQNWLDSCLNIRQKLINEDFGYPITLIAKILKTINSDFTIVSDVGNNEFWLCRAYAYAKCTNPAIYSKSYGTMGSSIGKAIGVYYGTKKPVICFVGDQALQMVVPELQYLVSNRLPITIVLLNNFSSGMIRTKQKIKYGKNFIHTTLDSGYSVPNFSNIAKAYGVKYYNIDKSNTKKVLNILSENSKLKFLEIKVKSSIEMIPHIPIGNEFQNMSPSLEKKKLGLLNKI